MFLCDEVHKHVRLRLNAYATQKIVSLWIFLELHTKFIIMKYSYFLSFMLVIILLSSCVATSKYKDALAREQSLAAQIAENNKKIDNLNGRLNEMQNENSRLSKQIEAAGKSAEEMALLGNMTQQQLQEAQRD